MWTVVESEGNRFVNVSLCVCGLVDLLCDLQASQPFAFGAAPQMAAAPAQGMFNFMGGSNAEVCS